jgi:hypothetical protein
MLILISGGQSGVGAGFLRVLRFPLPKPFIPPTSSSSQFKNIRKKIKMPPIGEGPRVAPFKGEKVSEVSRLAQRNVDF